MEKNETSKTLWRQTRQKKERKEEEEEKDEVAGRIKWRNHRRRKTRMWNNERYVMVRGNRLEKSSCFNFDGSERYWIGLACN